MDTASKMAGKRMQSHASSWLHGPGLLTWRFKEFMSLAFFIDNRAASRS
jgi:hypothetical protein